MKMKLWIYEIHIFELRNEEINVKKSPAVINPTYAIEILAISLRTNKYIEGIKIGEDEIKSLFLRGWYDCYLSKYLFCWNPYKNP